METGLADVPVRVTEHAAEQAERRGLDVQVALDVVRSPQQVVPLREFRQAISDDGRHVIRVLVDVSTEELVIVTMYRTSKIEKYWRP